MDPEPDEKYISNSLQGVCFVVLYPGLISIGFSHILKDL